jgi:acyl-ACP thioesterase
MPEPVLMPVPQRGRQFTATRKVRLGDVTATGRLRLDALARYLQDIATDDADDSGIAGPWILRKVALKLESLPHFGDMIELVTFCGGFGSRWAERRTRLTSNGAVIAEAAAIWVLVDAVTGHPAKLTDQFHALYGEAAGGRQVDARLRHGVVPPEATRRLWPLRASDVDVLGHVNNAAYWEPIEDELASRGDVDGRVAARAEMEFRAGIDADDEVELAIVRDAETLSMWFLSGGEARASARLAW